MLKKNYIVHGVKRRSSSFNTGRIDHLYQDPHEKNRKFILHYGDITDAISVSSIIKNIKPDEIYNLAAQSHVAVSFEVPEYTANADGIGALRILEAIKFHGFEKKTKFYQAGTSEMFGKVLEVPQNEKTPFYPRSPYGVAKVYAHWITVNYREAFNIFACNGILFNHESPVRGETFVTKKIIMALCRIKLNKQKKLFLGNLSAKRDWGHAKDYVEAMWKMLQKKTPDDYVISTGKQYSVKDFINLSLKELNIKYYWKGKGIHQKCYDEKGNCFIECDKEYFRPLEVDTLLGDSSKARKKLVFVSNESGSMELWTANQDGTSRKQLTNLSANIYNPVWSPDGNYIAFVASHLGEHALYLYDFNTQSSQSLPTGFSYHGKPSWAADSKSLLVANDQHVYRFDLKGNKLAKAIDSPTLYAYENKQGALIFANQATNQLWIKDPDSQTEQPLVSEINLSNHNSWYFLKATP